MKKLIGNLPGAKTNPKPEITVYPASSGKKNGIGLIIFEGGGYGGLASHEGKEYAEFFNRYGIAGFVVTYRVSKDGYRHPAMLEDALAAIGTIRKNAKALGINPKKIGVIGSSAGGHLAAHALVSYTKYKSRVSLRPDFGVLCYPVIAMDGPFCHKGSRQNLIGKTPSARLVQEVSPVKHVTNKTPSCFLWHTEGDATVPVENSLLFSAALRKNKVPFELYIYQRSGHGHGLKSDLKWGEECVRWMGEVTRTKVLSR